MGSCEKDKLPEKQRTLTSKAKQTKPLKCNVLDSCINPFQNKIKKGLLTYVLCATESSIDKQ